MEDEKSFDSLWLQLKSIEDPQPDTDGYDEFFECLSRLKQVIGEIQGIGFAAVLYRHLLELISQATEIDVSLVESIIKRRSDGSYGCNLKAEHWAVPVIAQSLGDYLIDCGGENYIQVAFQVTRDGQPVPFDLHLTLSHAGAEIPAQKAARLEAENRELRARLEKLEGTE